MKPTTAYEEVAHGIRELHRLMLEGRDESPEADAIRDAVDGPWKALSEVERDRARALSEDLHSVTDSSDESESRIGEFGSQTQVCLAKILKARQRGDLDGALALLRQSGVCLPLALVSYLRGSLWREAGDEASAQLFFEHAFDLQPGCDTQFSRLLGTS